MSHKGPCAKDFVLSLWHYWEGMKPLRVGHSGSHCEQAPEGNMGIPTPSLSLPLSFLPLFSPLSLSLPPSLSLSAS
jgi:hypothetical protein